MGLFNRMKRKQKNKKKQLSELLFLNEYILPRGFNIYDREGNQVSGKDRLMTDLFLRNEKIREREKLKTPIEIKEELKVRFSFLDLKNCPLCGEKPELNFFLRQYAHYEACKCHYPIFVSIYCSNCGCSLQCNFEYDNSVPYSNEERFKVADQTIHELVSKWDRRAPDLSVLRHYAGCATDILDPEEDKPSAEETNVTN